MRKHILFATIVTTGALAFTGLAQAGVAIDNNVDGIARYTASDHKKMYNKTRYKPMPSEAMIGNPANKKVSDKMQGNMNEIEPAAGKYEHENNHRYNQG